MLTLKQKIEISNLLSIPKIYEYRSYTLYLEFYKLNPNYYQKYINELFNKTIDLTSYTDYICSIFNPHLFSSFLTPRDRSSSQSLKSVRPSVPHSTLNDSLYTFLHYTQTLDKSI